MLKFENVLELSRRVFAQWEKTLSCEHCRTDRQSIMVLPMAAERVLALFEAASVTYGVVQSDSEMSNDQDGGQSSSPLSLHTRRLSGLESVPQQVVCLKSTMKFVKMELDASNAKLFVKVLLSRRLLKLCSLLEDLKEVIGRLWHKDWAQQTNTLKACQTSTAFIMDRLVVLIGEIR